MHFIQLSMKKEHLISILPVLAISVLRDLSPRWSAAILSHQFHGSDTHQKKVKKTSSELLQSCAPALCKMSLFLRLLIKISSTKSKYWNGGLRHFVGILLIKKFSQALREERNPISRTAGAELQTALQFIRVCGNHESIPRGDKDLSLSLGATQTRVDDTRCEWGTVQGASVETGQRQGDSLCVAFCCCSSSHPLTHSAQANIPGKCLSLNRGGCSRFH